MSVVVCPSCGEENPAKFRLCGFCGTALAPAAPPPEMRRTVTIVFSDLKGSTAMGEGLDPESVREVIARYFAEMRKVLERHGGRVEKFIGDAIMAVFGLPHAHEDDALRAVRAAAEMKASLAVINDELMRRWGVQLENRTGVNTGEVIAADNPDAQTLVTGDTVNVAARLEQAAPALEVLIGAPTYRLVRHAVEVEELEPLELKGKSERVPAYRLLSVLGEADSVVRRHEATMVGREAELRLLEEGFELARTHGRAQLVTVVGDAGLGKSRLIGELTSRLHDQVQILKGRALAYGEGITFWPLMGAVRQAAGIVEDDDVALARQRLSAVVNGREDVAARIASAIGLSQESFPVQDIFWAARELFRSLAEERPLLVVFEDVHWAEPTFLDLVEHLLAGVEAPLLVVCDSRPELLDDRGSWRDLADSTVIELHPLTAAESAEVIENMLGFAGIDDRVRSHVIDAAEGNPLFVEQLVSMLIDDGLVEQRDGAWHAREELGAIAIPPTIHMLLGARLDRLAPEERTIVDVASVIGQVFARDAVSALVPTASSVEVTERLALLSAKRLLEVGGGDDDGDGDMYRFHHALIRDTAYEALLKRRRATLHEQFVDWADLVNRERGRETEFEEILGYHLEQAHRYLDELGPLDEHGRSLGVRGSQKLASAGTRAFQRGDMAAAANLLRRAASLLPEEDVARLRLMPALGEALMETGSFAEAAALLDETLPRVPASEERLVADVRLARLAVAHHITEDLSSLLQEMLTEAQSLVPVLERLDAHAELAKAWRMIAFVPGSVCRWGEYLDAIQRAMFHARSAGDRRLEARLASGYTTALVAGPVAVEEAVTRTRELLDRGLPEIQAEAIVRASLADLLAMRLAFDEARHEYTHAKKLLEELGGGVVTTLATLAAARVELLAGRPEDAVGVLRPAYDELGSIAERYFRPLVGVMLAEALFELGEVDEAERTADDAAELADPDDIETQARLRAVRARLAGVHGDAAAAVDLARQGVEVTREPDAPVMRADALAILAEALLGAGVVDEAEEALAEARALYRGKGDDASVARLTSAHSKVA